MKDSIDLIPRETSKKRESQSAFLGSLLLGGFLLGTIIVVGLALTLRARTVEASVQPLREQVDEMRLLQTRVQPLSEALLFDLRRQQVAQRLVREPAWNGLISDLAAAVSGQVWIQSLQFEQASHTDTGSPPPTAKMIVTGTAATEQDLLGFMNGLAASPRLKLLAPRDSRQARGQEGQAEGRMSFVLEGIIAVEGDAAT